MGRLREIFDSLKGPEPEEPKGPAPCNTDQVRSCAAFFSAELERHFDALTGYIRSQTEAMVKAVDRVADDHERRITALEQKERERQ